MIAEPSSQVHCSSDVVVSLEDQHLTDRHATTYDRSRTVAVLDDGDGSAHQLCGVHADEHRPVPEPLGDPDAVAPAGLAHVRTEIGEDAHSHVVAALIDHFTEPTDVDEGERPLHPRIE